MRKKTRLKLSNIISILLSVLYCNIDVNLPLHNYCCHHISQNDFVQLFKCTFQKNKNNKKSLSFKKSSLLSAQKCMDFDGQPRLACNTKWCHNRYEIVVKLSCACNITKHFLERKIRVKTAKGMKIE